MDLRTLGQDDTQTEVEQTEEQVTLVPREITLTLNYLAPTGAKYQAVLVSRVPNGDERILIDRRTAVLSGAHWDHLSEYARLRCSALALVSVQVREIPDWLNQWLTEDDELLWTVGGECERHSSAWFRSALGSRAGDETATRVSCSSKHLASFDSQSVRPSEADTK